MQIAPHVLSDGFERQHVGSVGVLRNRQAHPHRWASSGGRLQQVGLQQVRLQQVGLQQVGLQQVRLQQVSLQQVRLKQVGLNGWASSGIYVGLRGASSAFAASLPQTGSTPPGSPPAKFKLVFPALVLLVDGVICKLGKFAGFAACAPAWSISVPYAAKASSAPIASATMFCATWYV